MKDADRKHRWVIKWLLTNIAADSLSEPFHDAFHAEFGGRRQFKYWGAQPVADAMAILKLLAKEGIADIRNVSLGRAWQPGFPKWCRSYSISTFGRETYGKPDALH